MFRRHSALNILRTPEEVKLITKQDPKAYLQPPQDKCAIGLKLSAWSGHPLS